MTLALFTLMVGFWSQLVKPEEDRISSAETSRRVEANNTALARLRLIGSNRMLETFATPTTFDSIAISSETVPD